jgi:hypothetical protein
MNEAVERRVIEVREELHALGFPADDVVDETLAKGMVLVRRDERWDVVEGYRVVAIDERTEWIDATSYGERDRLRTIRSCTVRLVGDRPATLAWPPGIQHVCAFDERRFFLGHLHPVDIFSGIDERRGPWVEMEMVSSGHFMIDVWGDRPG